MKVADREGKGWGKDSYGLLSFENRVSLARVNSSIKIG